jgi:DNA-binding XRE family transcriptional regulator
MATRTRRQIEAALRRKFQAERPDMEQLLASGDYTPPVTQAEYLPFVQAVRRLQSARKAAGVSLAAMARQTGIDKAALSRLENGVADNPTIGTLNRYAQALGKVLVMQIVDRPRAERKRRAKTHR